VRILVAEDEALIRLDLVEALAEVGYEVVAAVADGEAAIAAGAALQPEVALIDIRMPRLDGLSVARQLTTSGVAVVMVTAHSTMDVIAAASDAGAMAYLVKPVSPSDLAPAIEVARARHAEVRELTGQVTHLAEALRGRRLIDRAKARLQAAGMTEADAFRLLQRRAMDGRTTMVSVAEGLLAEPGPRLSP